MHNRPALILSLSLGHSARSLPNSVPLGGFAGNKHVLRSLPVTFVLITFVICLVLELVMQLCIILNMAFDKVVNSN